MERTIRSVLLGLVLVALALAAQVPLAAAPPQTPNLLANINGTLYELTPGGQVVQTGTIPRNLPGQDAADYPRDLLMDRKGNLFVFNGTFAPQLSRYDTVTGTWTHRTFAGWSTVNNTTWGGLAASGDFVYATDCATAGNGAPAGIVRFNLADGTAERFLATTDFRDLTLGLDGLLYGLASPSENWLVVIDPATMTVLRNVTLPVDLIALTADAKGDLYGVERIPGNIDRFSPTGQPLKSLSTGTTYLSDIDLSADGKLVVGARDEQIFLTDTSLNSVNPIRPANFQFYPTWVAFVERVPPSDLRASAILSSQVHLSWTDNSTATTGFEIERKTGDGSFGPLATVGALPLNYDDFAVAPETRYTYRLRAIYADGVSVFSNEATTTTGPLPPQAPAALTATPVSTNRIDLAWQDTNTNEFGFFLEKKSPGGSFVEIARLGANENRFTDPSVVANTAYAYRVKTYNPAGTSPYSNEATALTWPESPSGLRVSTPPAPAGRSRLTLNWNDNNPVPCEHQVQRSGDGGATFEDAFLAPAGKTDYVDFNLKSARSYTYRVRARNSTGETIWTPAVSGTTLVAPPDPPQGLAVQTLSASALRLTWTDASDNETGFRIERKVSTGQFFPLTSVAAGTTTYDHTGLAPQSTETYRVVATNGVGESPPSAEASGTTLPLPPGTPTGLTAQAGEGQVRLEWTAVAGATSYNLYRRSSASGNGTAPYRTLVTGTQFVDDGLTNGTLYSYRLSAVGPGGESPQSAEVSALPLARPAPPAGLIATPGSGFVRLAWTASPAATGYRVKRALQPAGPFQEIAGNLTRNTYSDTGLTNGTTYYYVVAALSPIGASDESAPVSATPQAPEVRPAPPTGLTARATGTAVSLKWRQSATPGVGQNRVYRAPRASGPYAPLATVRASTAYTDRSAKRGVSYFYAVTALSRTGLESLQSNRASAKRR